jgi:ribosome biogenesis GTPase
MQGRNVKIRNYLTFIKLSSYEICNQSDQSSIFVKKRKLEGTVIKSTGSWYYVEDPEGKKWACKIKGKFRIKGIRTTNPVAVGDHVVFSVVQENPNEGLITELKDRKNYIIRKATKLSKESHIIAANIDQAVVMATLSYPETFTLFIDRFLVTAEAYQIPAIILFNKTDLYSEVQKQKLDQLKNIYSTIGYGFYSMSLETGENLDQIKSVLKDKQTVISGNSGVGKSTLINTIIPDCNIKTEEVSNSHKTGKHTTTFAERYTLPFGGHIIDTPGIKGFGLVDMDKEEIYHYFPEIFDASLECKFHNCLHKEEPGCNVKHEVEEGSIDSSRYYNYLRILEDNETKYR